MTDFQTAAMRHYYNDIDPYCCKVLHKNIMSGNLPEGDVDERDIRDIHATDLVGYDHISLFAGIGGISLGLARSGLYDIPGLRTLNGGFPCQPHSLAGKREGSMDERDLWGEYHRLIREFKPHWILAENVPGLLSSESGRFFGRILRDLAASGYDAQWQTLPASAFGAPHQRDRVFIVAYDSGQRVQRLWTQPIQRVPAFSWCQDVRSVEDLRNRSYLPPSLIWGNRNGVSAYVDRIRAIGNSVVPQCAEYIGRCITAALTAESRVGA